jgi:bifunctional UDP-N-acetylglucosamine pyrophosphorylase / glucosamine-1-phosphate N-acetyltransferase
LKTWAIASYGSGMQLDITGVVLAAGMGKRMRSEKSKVLFVIAGRPLLIYPLRALRAVGVNLAVVVASPANRLGVADCLDAAAGDLAGLDCSLAVQEQQLGTGDAVRAALGQLTTEWTLILYGDGPLILERDLAALIAATAYGQGSLALLTCRLADPKGYGRILRRDGAIVGIREERDLLDEQERQNTEVNPGIYLLRTALLREALASLRPNNAQHEYYLTDIVAFAAERGTVQDVPAHASALLGVNDRWELARAEQLMFERIRERHARAGVTLHGEPQIDDSVELEPDVEISAQVVLRGNTRIGAGSVVDVGCVLSDASVGRSARLKPYSVVTESVVGDGAQVGPFAHLRPGSVLEEQVHVGNFVETKQTRLRAFAKANHLAYLGDADIGEKTNVGAGTIVCNYDGFAKWRTTIGAGAFIGSDSQLVAPLNIGNGAYVATGSTVTEDVPDDALAIGRSRQINKPGYAIELRRKLKQRAPTK